MVEHLPSKCKNLLLISTQKNLKPKPINQLTNQITTTTKEKPKQKELGKLQLERPIFINIFIYLGT
jgi:hypothetical protein